MALVNLQQILQAFPELKIHQFNNNQSENSNGKTYIKDYDFTSYITKIQQQSRHIFLSDVVFDSREVTRNSIYFILPYLVKIPEQTQSTNGEISTSSTLASVINGRASQAIGNGVRIIVSEREILDQVELNGQKLSLTSHGNSVIYLSAVNCQQVLAGVSNLFYPLQPKWLISITGTNGKTSTVTFTRQLLGYLQKKVASLGTLGLQLENMENMNDHKRPYNNSSTSNNLRLTNNTTLYAPTFHKCVNTLVADFGMEYLVFEASSHGIKEHRLHGLQNKIQIGVFTNLTHDHLDYHGNMNDYFESKCKLFSELMIDDGSGIAFLCNKLENKYLEIIKGICEARNIKVWMYGENTGDLNFKFLSDFSNKNSQLELNLWETMYGGINLRHFPKFQMENLLVSLGIVASLIKLSSSALIDITRSLPEIIESVPGRMEFVGQNQFGSKIFVDYAHTPNALEIVLNGIKNDFNPNRLVVVFGCGGNRDANKRAIMGQIAVEHATHIIITDDNPRFENPTKIRQEILAGCHQTQNINKGINDETNNNGLGNVSEIKDIGGRYEAILHGISILADSSDVLVVCGKGAEKYQIIGEVYTDFSDKQAVLDILEKHKKSLSIHPSN